MKGKIESWGTERLNLLPEVTQPGNGKAETGTRQSSSRARESLLSKEDSVAQGTQPESDAQLAWAFCPHLLCDVGHPVPSLGLRFFTYQQGEGTVWQDSSQIIQHCGLDYVLELG